jgi:hypothetical protein
VARAKYSRKRGDYLARLVTKEVRNQPLGIIL